MVVALTRSESHYEGVFKALELLSDYIVNDMKYARTIMIKPNFVSTHVQLAATHVDSVKALMDFIYEYVGTRKILLAEGPALGSLETGLRNFGYLKLAEEYDIEFFDLNMDTEYEVLEIYDRRLKRKVKVRVSKRALDADYRISICRPKTHDTVVVTLSIKNMVMGAVMGGDKPKVHQGYLAINMNIAELAKYLMPHLSVIDGYIGMEGNGPVSGTSKRWGIAIAGNKAVEVDAITAWLMGFNPKDVGYLYFLHKMGYGEIDPNKIRIIGERPDLFKTRFIPHRTIKAQLKWIEGRERALEILGLK